MAQSSAFRRRCAQAFVSGFFVAVPVTVTVLDRLAYIARVEGASMQPSLNPEGQTASDVVLLSRWSVRDYQVQRGDIVSLLTRGYKNRYVKVPDGHFWIEGDHHGHSLDSNSFGPVSLGLVHGRASHIIWPPHRWQRITPSLPGGRVPLLHHDRLPPRDQED
ncbi:mitochondrial inner membrane protease subunit 2 isoform X2 [Brienomyrus brachyistius]|uniref:mitochondrial inner membrane protease subunit 2 isoform X2 n=1 Tax=Brienomyrus brachyistius TaxID=42636 RepID=UPI0020B29580|nr:mitochondrial inner membrane protease subunit 2 isoform X2 [Brienomyrus brachyistius]